MKQLNPTKATGPDNINPRVLKEVASEIAPSLTLIYRASMKSGIVPKDWKSAHIAPVLEKGERYKPENYRPISLTTIACKLLEPSWDMWKNRDMWKNTGSFVRSSMAFSEADLVSPRCRD